VLKVFKPEEPFTVLGGHNYEVYLFQKKHSLHKGIDLTMDFEGDAPGYTDEMAFSGNKSYHVTKDKLYLNLLVVNTVNLGKDSSLLNVSGKIFVKQKFDSKDVVLVVSREGDNSPYFYKTFGLSDLAKANKWSGFDFNITLAPAASEDELLKVYFWNRKRKEFWIDDIKIKVTKHNQTSEPAK
jgi:hypothetical protein